MPKKSLSLVLAAALCLSLGACGTKPEPQSKPEPTPPAQVAAVLPANDPYAAQLATGMKQAAELFSADVVVEYRYYNSKEEEEAILSALNPETVQGLISVPNSSDTSIALLRRAYDKGIAVAVADTLSEKTSFAVYTVQSDPYQLGKAAGEQAKKYITETLKGKATLAIIEHSSRDYQESTLRLNGFLDQLKDMKDVKISKDMDAADAKDRREQVDEFLKNKDTVDVIFSTTGEGLVDAHNGLKTAKWQKAPALFGVGAYDAVTTILAGTENDIRAVATEDYFQVGQDTAAALFTELSRRNNPPVTDSGASSTKDSVSDSGTPAAAAVTEGERTLAAPVLLTPADKALLADYTAHDHSRS